MTIVGLPPNHDARFWVIMACCAVMAIAAIILVVGSTPWARRLHEKRQHSRLSRSIRGDQDLSETLASLASTPHSSPPLGQIAGLPLPGVVTAATAAASYFGGTQMAGAVAGAALLRDQGFMKSLQRMRPVMLQPDTVNFAIITVDGETKVDPFHDPKVRELYDAMRAWLEARENSDEVVAQYENGGPDDGRLVPVDPWIIDRDQERVYEALRALRPTWDKHLAAQVANPLAPPPTPPQSSLDLKAAL